MFYWFRSLLQDLLIRRPSSAYHHPEKGRGHALVKQFHESSPSLRRRFLFCSTSAAEVC